MWLNRKVIPLGEIDGHRLLLLRNLFKLVSPCHATKKLDSLGIVDMLNWQINT